MALFRSDTIENPLRVSEYMAEFNNPNVDAVRYRGAWNKINPSPGVYDWSNIDETFTLAAQYGKKVGLSIACGLSTPMWIYSQGVTRYDLLDGSGSMPLPWETAYQGKLFQFISDLAAKYEPNPLLSYIIITGFMQENGMFLANAADEEAMPHEGYSDIHSAYIDAAQKIIEKWMSSFPTTSAIVTLQAPFEGSDGQANQTDVKNYGLGRHPAHFGTFFNGRRGVPAPHDPPTMVSWPKGSQMFWWATNNPDIYIPPPPVPLPPDPIPLQDCLQYAETLGDQFVEAYRPDLEQAVAQIVLGIERIRLKDNVPPDRR